jgi:hypothetical protein
MSFSRETVEDVLVACGRICCICRKFCGVRIELHHIKPQHKGGDDSLENCIPLCFDCHAEVEHYNTNHPRGRKFTPGELIKHRDKWFATVCELNTPLPEAEEIPSPVSLSVSGTNNMVAGRDLHVTTSKIVKKTIVHTDPGGKHITNDTARKIHALVQEYIDNHKVAEKNPSSAAKRIWGKLKKEFNVTTYKEIAFEDSERAVQWVHAELAKSRPIIRRKDPARWKQSFFKPIYTRMGELGMSKDELYAMAQSRLALKKPITSLKDLTQSNLEKLNRMMIAEVNKRK